MEVNRGAFCYDVITEESLRDWKPQERDLIFLTKIARSIISKNLKFERLEVDRESAIKMFNNNRSVSLCLQHLLTWFVDKSDLF